MSNTVFFNVNDVMELLGVSRAYAYRIIKSLNNELVKSGYMVISGKIPRVYLLERYYALDQKGGDE